MNQMTEQKGNPLGYAPIGKLLAKFALPAVVSMLVNAVYNIVDQIFIGQGVGYLGNAATTVAFPVVTIILAVSTLLGAGGSAYAAIKLGEKREEEAERTLGNLFVLLTGIGILVAVLGLVFLDPMLRLFGATDSVMEYSRQYTSIILLGTPFNML
ncbi:MAG: MATE family efflux transporter, partial [Hungatella hathewayi]|nr:MATE family efflux transporter [Hungatella hathewayi]